MGFASVNMDLNITHPLEFTWAQSESGRLSWSVMVSAEERCVEHLYPPSRLANKMGACRTCCVGAPLHPADSPLTDPLTSG